MDLVSSARGHSRPGHCRETDEAASLLQLTDLICMCGCILYVCLCSFLLTVSMWNNTVPFAYCQLIAFCIVYTPNSKAKLNSFVKFTILFIINIIIPVHNSAIICHYIPCTFHFIVLSVNCHLNNIYLIAIHVL